MPTIIVEADEGKTIDQKRGLVKDITEAVCKNYNVDPQVVTILLHEQKKENRAKGGVLIVDR
ncbi:MAG: tautomerase family protein [Deltaproteobacteria bacterium]|jgi:4-oxalocrotonate tautomerase|nr:tautomerase family protein [Deltaproteobacteria bacterium]